ncbi:hypothetical protein P5673_018348 [Acropora cervicornis]|uniref:Uncharacterized protein n=1 Tax=Acropora cervicornis TaxID=6130 RepID=A0AAD9QDA7_ACRCE|nr:hypothetical protein P5673_018348 [Acropora cervicornis]
MAVKSERLLCVQVESLFFAKANGKVKEFKTVIGLATLVSPDGMEAVHYTIVIGTERHYTAASVQIIYDGSSALDIQLIQNSFQWIQQNRGFSLTFISRQDTEGHPMDSEAKTKGQNSLNILESLMKDGDLKSALEKAKQWAGNNPVPSEKMLTEMQAAGI